MARTHQAAGSTNGAQHKHTTQPNAPANQPTGPPSVVVNMDPNKIVPIQITLPAQPNGPNSEARVLTIHVPASALQENQLHQALTATPIITSILSLPPALASTVLQQHIDSVLANNATIKQQLDGAADTSDDENSDASDDLDNNEDDDEVDKDEDENDDMAGAEEEPLNSDDDVSEEEQADLFDTDNVVVCQYDKVCGGHFEGRRRTLKRICIACR